MAEDLKIVLGSRMDLKLAQTQIKAFIDKYEKQKIKLSIDPIDLKNINSQLSGINSVLKNMGTNGLQNVNAQFDTLGQNATKIVQKLDPVTNEVKKQTETYRLAAGQILQYKKNITSVGSEIVGKTFTQDNKAASDEILRVENAYAQLQNRLMRMDSSKVYSMLMGKDSSLKTSRSDIANKMADLNKEIENGTLTMEKFKQSGITQDINRLGASLDVAKNKMGGFTAELLTSITAFVRWYAIGNLVGSVRREIVKLVDTVGDLNKQLVNLQMATGGTYEETYNLLQSYSLLGSIIGASTAEIAESANEYLRQGKSIAETNTLIYDTMVLSKTGMIDSASAASYLTTVTKGYKVAVEDVIGVVDQLTAVDMVSATSAGGLAEGMAQTANGARLAGVEMSKLLGYIAVVGETTGEAMSSVGNTFSTIFARMGNIKLKRLIDPTTGEDLSNVETTLRRLKIELRENETTFRNFGDVLDDVGGKWATYNDVDKRALALSIAGKDHYEAFVTLMENYGKALEYTSVATNSSGTAMQKMEAYENSVEAATKRMTAAFEMLSNNTLDANFLIGGINAITALTKGLDFLLNKTAGFTPTLAVVAAGYFALNSAQKTNLLTTLKQIPANIAATASLVAEGYAAKGLAGAFAALNAVSPLAVITAISAALWLLVKAADWSTTSLKEHKEALSEVSAKYSELTSEISDLESQKETTRDRLDELTIKDTLTIIEQEELTKLQKTNDELQRSLDIKKADAIWTAEQKAKTTQDTFNAQRNEDDYYQKVLALQEINRRLASNEDAFLAGNLSSDKYNKQQNKLNTDYAKIRSEIVDLNKAFTPLIQSYDDLIAAGGKLNKEQQSQYDWWKTVNGEYNDFILSSNKTTAATNAAANSAENAATELENLDTTYKEYIKDVDFATEQAERQKKSGKEQIAIYQGAIDKIKEQIALYRTMGLDNTSDEVQTLTKKIWEYEDAITKINESLRKDLIKSFSDLVKEIKSVNDALEEQEKTGSVSVGTYLDLITNNADLIKVFKTENGQIILNKEAYKSLTIAKIANIQAAKISERQAIIDKINEENKAVSSLISTYNNMFINQAFVDFYQGAMDGRYSNVTKPFDAIITALQKVMDSLKDDIFDFNPPKDTSSDPWKKEFEDQYKVLQHKRGMNIVSTEDYYNQLSALNEKYFTKDKKYNDEYTQYQLELYNLKKSMFADSIEDQAHQAELLANKSGTEQQQIQIYENILKQLHAKANEYRAKGIDENDEMIQDLQKQWRTYQDKIDEIHKDSAENIRKSAKNSFEALNDTFETLKEIVKLQKEDELDALDDLADRYDDIVDSQLKSLELEKKKSDYQDDVAEKVKVIAKKEAQLNIAKLDTSREGQAKQIQLADELYELQKDLTDTQKDYQYDVTKEALEDERDEYKKNIDKKKKDIQSFLNDETAMYDAATNLMAQDSTSLQNMLRNYYIEQGKLIDNEVINKWKLAKEAASEYGSVTAALTGLSNISSSESNEDLIASLKSIMKQNSADWFTASASKKKELEAANVALASKIGNISGQQPYKKDGRWYQNGVPLYHEGGAVGGKSLLSNERLILGQTLEHMLTQPQQRPLIDLINSNTLLTGALLKTPILTNSILPNVSNISNANNGSFVFNPVMQFEIGSNVTDKAGTKRIVTEAANEVIGVLNTSLKKAGLGNSQLGLIK
jgi:TP901 family phage tail tape measure protein